MNEDKISTWRMKDGETIQIADMQDSHIQNCIAMLKKNMPDSDEDEVITADHWSLEFTPPVIVHGADWYRSCIKAFEEELATRLSSKGQK